jgi:hypothetical protein
LSDGDDNVDFGSGGLACGHVVLPDWDWSTITSPIALEPDAFAYSLGMNAFTFSEAWTQITDAFVLPYVFFNCSNIRNISGLFLSTPNAYFWDPKTFETVCSVGKVYSFHSYDYSSSQFLRFLKLNCGLPSGWVALEG